MSLLSPLADRLFGLAKEVNDFANEQTEMLSFDDYSNLTWYEAKLLAYGNLLSETDRDRFLEDEIAEVSEYMDYLRVRTGQRASP